MSDAERCPMCAAGPLAQIEGQLEQSGETHLVTSVHRCAVCGYARYDPAPHGRWEADPPLQAPARTPRPLRRAA